MASDLILEATARAITYYLDVSQECTRRIVACEGTIRAICTRLLVIETDNKTSRDLAEQCIKSLELICARESSAVYESGGLACILPFVLEHGHVIHMDTLHSAMSVITRLCAKMEPAEASLDHCVETLSKLLKHEDGFVADGALRCFASLSDRFTRKQVDPAPLARHGLLDELVKKLGDSITNNTASSVASGAGSSIAGHNAGVSSAIIKSTGQFLNQSSELSKSLASSSSTGGASNAVSISTLTSLLSTLCRNSEIIFKSIVTVPETTRLLLDAVRKFTLKKSNTIK